MKKIAEGEFLTLFIEKKNDPAKAPGVIVSKKVAGLAVTRNKIKRRVREALKELKVNTPRGYFWVVRVNKDQRLPWRDFKNAILGLINKSSSIN